MVHKTGKITVASYSQWRNIKTLDYQRFYYPNGERRKVVLNVDYEYKIFGPDEYVFNHKGKQLFFPTYFPDEIPVFDSGSLDFNQIRPKIKMYAVRYKSGEVSYSVTGMDCSGVPTFSHMTADNIATHYKDMNQFEPLTVKTVIDWFGWFAYQLNNAELTFR